VQVFENHRLIGTSESDRLMVSSGRHDIEIVNETFGYRAARTVQVSPGKVTPITSAFKDWKGTSFADDQSPKNNGLTKPKVVTAKSKEKGAPVCQVKIGDESKDKLSYFVMTGKSNDVLMAPKWSVDRILVKPEDLKKATVAAKK